MGFWRRLNDRLFNFPLRFRLPVLLDTTRASYRIARAQMDDFRRDLERELEINYAPPTIEEPTLAELEARARRLFKARDRA